MKRSREVFPRDHRMALQLCHSLCGQFDGCRSHVLAIGSDAVAVAKTDAAGAIC